MEKQDKKKTIQEMIQQKLVEIEQKEKVTILYAVESGSRSWGIASPDSDYDVRFIYKRSLEYYLGLQGKKDYIDWELNKTLDINGWDLSKVLQHFHKSNATIFEWSNSPIVYCTSKEWEKIKQETGRYFSCKACMYHYYGSAYKNYQAYLLEDMVNYKKYFYVLRPLLACKWIETRKCPPPVLFSELAEAVLEEDKKEIVRELVAKKVQMSEKDKEKQLKELNHYLLQSICYYKEVLTFMQDDRTADWEPLNRLFQSLLPSNSPSA